MNKFTQNSLVYDEAVLWQDFIEFMNKESRSLYFYKQDREKMNSLYFSNSSVITNDFIIVFNCFVNSKLELCNEYINSKSKIKIGTMFLLLFRYFRCWVETPDDHLLLGETENNFWTIGHC